MPHSSCRAVQGTEPNGLVLLDHMEVGVRSIGGTYVLMSWDGHTRRKRLYTTTETHDYQSALELLYRCAAFEVRKTYMSHVPSHI